MFKKKLIIFITISLFLFSSLSNFSFANESMYGKELFKGVPPIGVSALNGILPIFGLWSYLQGDIGPGISQTLLWISGSVFFGIAFPVSNLIGDVVSNFTDRSTGSFTLGVSATAFISIGAILVFSAWLTGIIAPYTYASRRNRVLQRSGQNLLKEEIFGKLQYSSNNTNVAQLVNINSKQNTVARYNTKSNIVAAVPIYFYNF